MKRRMRMALVGAGIGASSAVLLAQAQDRVDVDPESYQGRTAAAIAEFRAAVELEPDRAHGAELFRSCAECHGADGSGSADGAVPVIAGQHVSVLVKQLVDFRHDRRWSERMQGAAKQHQLAGPQDLLDVSAFAESLERPTPRDDVVRDHATQLEGQRVYFRDCEGCHGRLGQGELRRMRPRLAGQHYPYLVKQLNETAAGERPGMDAAHVKLIGALSVTERAAVAEFLAGLTPELSSTRN
jgi:cytochrome c553